MDEYDRREFLSLSLPSFLGVLTALPSLCALATRANAAEGRLPEDGAMHWEAFLEAVSSSSLGASSVSPSQCSAGSAGSLCSSSSGASSVSPSQCLARSAGLLAQASECPASTPPSHPRESTSASLGGCQAHSWRPQISSSICTTLWGPPSSPATEPACTPRQPPCTQLSYGRMGR